LDEDVGPITVMNKFNVDPQEVDEFLQVFAMTTPRKLLNRNPGFIFAQLHRGIAGSTTFVNYIVWPPHELDVCIDMSSFPPKC
jgi:hypothetical protein